MERADKYIERVLKHEGGYINHPNDPGGETNYGITLAVARDNGYKGAIRDLPKEVAVEIYRKKYWAPVEAMGLPIGLDFQVFDAFVNHGMGNTVRILQRAVGVRDDGLFGILTEKAVAERFEEYDLLGLCILFNQQRMAWYTDLGSWGSFGRGWIRRIIRNLGHALEDV